MYVSWFWVFGQSLPVLLCRLYSYYVLLSTWCDLRAKWSPVWKTFCPFSFLCLTVVLCTVSSCTDGGFSPVFLFLRLLFKSKTIVDKPNMNHTLSVVSVSLSEEDVGGWLEVSNWAGCPSYKDKTRINMLLFSRYSSTTHWLSSAVFAAFLLDQSCNNEWVFFYYWGCRIVNALLFIHRVEEFICSAAYDWKTWSIFIFSSWSR